MLGGRSLVQIKKKLVFLLYEGIFLKKEWREALFELPSILF